MEINQMARDSLASTLRKNQKALETLTAKDAKPWQISQVSAAIDHHRTLLTLVEGGCPDRADVEAALAAIPVYTARIEKILPKFPAGTSQHTLAVRRLAAYALAAEIGKCLLLE